MRGRTRARILLLTLAAVLGLSAAVALPSGPAEAADGDLVVELTTVAPAVLRTGDVLTVTGTITNTTDAELPRPAVRLLMQQHVPSSPDTLADWFDFTSDLNVVALTGWNPVESEDPLPPGGSVPFAIELATEGTFAEFAAWGPRGIEIQAMSEAALGSVRTTLIWYPTEPPLQTPAELTLLVPLTPTAQEWATAVEQQTPVGEVAAPRLLEVLDAVGLDASLAIDPALLETEPPGAVPTTAGAASPATETPTTQEPSTTDPTTDPTPEGPLPRQAELVAALAQADPRRDLIGLGYADADLTALAADGGEVLWSDGTERGAALFEAAGITVENVAWPAGRVSSGAVGTLADDGAAAVVLDADDLASSEISVAKATVTSPAGDLEALLADDELGVALVDTTLTGVAAQQATLALSAVLTRALPQDPGGFLVVLPRDVGADGLDELSERLEALLDAPWLQPANLRSLLGRTDTTGTTLELPDAVESDGAIAPGDVADLLEGRTLVGAYAEAAGDTIVGQYAPSLLTPLSATLRANLRRQLLDAAETAMDQLGSAIRVESGSDVLLISGTGSMPVTITNDLTVPATVYVELVPDQTRVQVRETPQRVLPPGESTTVRIPITAVANGNVTIDVRVLPSPGGPDLAAPASFSVRVRADWENIGTGVVAGLLAIAFVIGLIRTIRRGGRRAAAQ